MVKCFVSHILLISKLLIFATNINIYIYYYVFSYVFFKNSLQNEIFVIIHLF